MGTLRNESGQPARHSRAGAGKREGEKAKELLVVPGNRLGLQYLPSSVGETEAAGAEGGQEGGKRNPW